MILPFIPSELCLISLRINIFHLCGMELLFFIVFPGWRRVDAQLWVFFPIDSHAAKISRAKSDWARAVLVLQELDSQAAGKNNSSSDPILSYQGKKSLVGALGLLWYSTSVLGNISILALELGILVFEELINVADKPRILFFLLIFRLNFCLGNICVQEKWWLVGEVGRGRWSAWGPFSKTKFKKGQSDYGVGWLFFQLLTYIFSVLHQLCCAGNTHEQPSLE